MKQLPQKLRFTNSVIRYAILFFVLLTISVEIQAENRPRISIDARVYNFGTVSQGTVVQHDFIVANTGAKDLLIQRLSAACGCTVANLPQNTISAGQKVAVQVSLDTTPFVGAINKKISLFSTDPTESSSILIMKGRVEPAVLIEPRRIDLGTVQRHADAELAQKSVSVRALEDSSVTLGSITSPSRYLRLTEESRTSQQVSFTARLVNNPPTGDFRAQIVIGVNGSKNPSFIIPVFGTVVGVARAVPPQVSFGIIGSRGTINRRVRLEALSRETTLEAVVRKTPPGVKAKLNPTKKGLVVALELDAATVSRELRDTVEIEITKPRPEIISLPVFALHDS